MPSESTSSSPKGSKNMSHTCLCCGKRTGSELVKDENKERTGNIRVQTGPVEMQLASRVLQGCWNWRVGRTGQCGRSGVTGGRDLSPGSCLLTALFLQVAVLPGWNGGRWYQLALCKSNKSQGRNRQILKDHFC